MATLGERLVIVERRADENRTLIQDIRNDLYGGGGITFERSLSGRMEAIEKKEAAMAIVTKQRVRWLKGWQAVVLTFCAVITAACAIIAALASVGAFG